MAAIGGDILSVNFTHPTLGSGTFFPKSGEDSTFDPGGFRTADDTAMITGSGTPIYQMNNSRWMFEVTCASDMNTNEDMEKLAALSASTEEANWTISHINGTTYAGKGKPVGDIQANGNAGTITLKVSGGGGMKKI